MTRTRGQERVVTTWLRPGVRRAALMVVIAVPMLIGVERAGGWMRGAQWRAATEDTTLQSRVTLDHMQTLGERGPSAVPELLEHLSAGAEEPVRQAAALALGRIGGGEAEAAVPALLEMATQSPDATSRTTAALAIGMIAPSSPDVSNALAMELANDPEAPMRQAVAHALGRLPGTRESADALAAALVGDGCADVRSEASGALARLGDLAVDALQPLVGKVSPTAEAAIARTLGAMKAPSGDALALLTRLQQSKDPEVACAAASGLVAHGYTGTSLDTLRHGLRDDRPSDTRIEAARAIGTLGPSAAHAVSDLAECLDPSCPEAVRLAALEALHQIGPAARLSYGAVVPLVDDPSPRIQAMARWALQSIGAPSDDDLSPDDMHR